MLTFFIAMVLISEIIITYHIVSFILKIDSKVCELNRQIISLTPKIESGLTKVRIILNKILLGMNKFEQKLQSNKEKFKYTMLKNLITIVLFLILNTKSKKILSVVELVFDIKNFIAKLSKILVLQR